MIKTKVETVMRLVDGYLVEDSDKDIEVAAFLDGSGVLIRQGAFDICIDEESVDNLMEALRYAKENSRYNRENKQ